MSLTLAYRETGNGAPLVMLHGLFGSAANWGVIARALAGRCHVYSLDLRNHGRSPHASTMSYPEMAGDVQQFLEDHDLQDVIVLGHSMGGKVAMQLALTMPDRIGALIPVDIAPVRYESRRFDFVTAMLNLDTAAISSREEADKALAPMIPDDEGRRFLLTNLQAKADGSWHWRINLQAIADSVQDILDFPDPGAWSTFAGPVRFLAGGESGYVLPEHEAAIRQFFPAATIARVPGSGHNPHTEDAEATVACLNDFLDQFQEVLR